MMETEIKYVSDTEAKRRRSEITDAASTSGFIMFVVTMAVILASGYVGYDRDVVSKLHLGLTNVVPFVNVFISFIFVAYLGSKKMDELVQYDGYVERYRRWFREIERGIILGQIIVIGVHMAMILNPTESVFIAGISFSLLFTYGILVKVVLVAKTAKG